jgi:hypothetical protein
MSQTINHFRRGEMDLRAAKAIIQMASLMLRSLKEARLGKEKEEKASRTAKKPRRESPESVVEELELAASQVIATAYDEMPTARSAAHEDPYANSHGQDRPEPAERRSRVG